MIRVITLSDGSRIEKQLEELTEEATDGLVRLGTAAGANLGHCVSLGMKYCENFKDRVIGYRMLTTDPLLTDQKEFFGNQSIIAVAFYGHKNP